jgi:hypothetical protein
MYAYDLMLQAVGVCALATDRAVIGIAMDSTRINVTIDNGFFDNTIFCKFICFFLLFVAIKRVGNANKPSSPIVMINYSMQKGVSILIENKNIGNRNSNSLKYQLLAIS